MISLFRIVVGAAVWAGALWGSLWIANVHTSWDHAACGAWGCGPPATALVSCHLAWLIALAPLAIVGKWWLPWRWRRQFGFILAGLAVAVILGVVAREATTWLPTAGDYQRKYFVQRCVFVVATWIEVPLVQVAAIGWFWLIGPVGRPGRVKLVPGDCKDSVPDSRSSREYESNTLGKS